MSDKTIDVSVKYPEETFYYVNAMYDVAQAWRLISDGHGEHGTVEVAELMNAYLKRYLPGNEVKLFISDVALTSRVEGMTAEEFAMSDEVDLSIPLIAVTEDGTNGNELHLFIDGYSRIYKAYKLGVKQLYVIALNKEDTNSIRTGNNGGPGKTEESLARGAISDAIYSMLETEEFEEKLLALGVKPISYEMAILDLLNTLNKWADSQQEY